MKKIVVIGPESTGKSTLCQQLAEHYGTTWCPEYAREYLLRNGKNYTFDNLLQIAKGQLALEDRELLNAKNDCYIIDTNMYVMKVWCEVVFNNCHTWILKQAVNRQYDLTLLCDVDLPWVEDELREYPGYEMRRKLFLMYKDLLVQSNENWALISGSYEERLQGAINIINTLPNNKFA